MGAGHHVTRGVALHPVSDHPPGRLRSREFPCGRGWLQHQLSAAPVPSARCVSLCLRAPSATSPAAVSTRPAQLTPAAAAWETLPDSPVGQSPSLFACVEPPVFTDSRTPACDALSLVLNWVRSS